jgi:KipI family sensor histidine kinase inhibitor
VTAEGIDPASSAVAGLQLMPLGETAMYCQVSGAIRLSVQRRIWAFERAVRGAIDGVQTSVGMTNLTVFFDPLVLDPDTLRERLEALWARCGPEDLAGDTVQIPVVYGGPGGPDLPLVARHCGLEVDEVVRLHAARVYTVFFVGFLPGFGYLGELDPRLATPRRAEPRLRVAAGSVGIGGEQTGIYPLASPGGWQLIGRAQATLFDPARSPPALLRPGMNVRFVVEKILPC